MTSVDENTLLYDTVVQWNLLVPRRRKSVVLPISVRSELLLVYRTKSDEESAKL